MNSVTILLHSIGITFLLAGLGLLHASRRVRRIRELPRLIGQPATVTGAPEFPETIDSILGDGPLLARELRLIGCWEKGRRTGRTLVARGSTLPTLELVTNEGRLAVDAETESYSMRLAQEEELPRAAAMPEGDAYVCEGQRLPRTGERTPKGSAVSNWILEEWSAPLAPWLTAAGVVGGSGDSVRLRAPVRLSASSANRLGLQSSAWGLSACILGLGLFSMPLIATPSGSGLFAEPPDPSRWASLEQSSLGSPSREALQALGPNPQHWGSYVTYSPTQGWGVQHDGNVVETLWACARAFGVTDGAPRVEPSSRPYRGVVGPNLPVDVAWSDVTALLGPAPWSTKVGDLRRNGWPATRDRPVEVAVWVLEEEPGRVACWELRAPGASAGH